MSQPNVRFHYTLTENACEREWVRTGTYPRARQEILLDVTSSEDRAMLIELAELQGRRMINGVLSVNLGTPQIMSHFTNRITHERFDRMISPDEVMMIVRGQIIAERALRDEIDSKKREAEYDRLTDEIDRFRTMQTKQATLVDQMSNDLEREKQHLFDLDKKILELLRARDAVHLDRG